MLCDPFVVFFNFFCSFNMSTKGSNFFEEKDAVRSFYKKDAVKGAPQFRSARKKLSSDFDECPGALFSLLKIAGKAKSLLPLSFLKSGTPL